MAILKGKNILDKVRRKIKDETYGSFDEINEAQSWIAKKTHFNWLRKSNIVGAGLVPDQKEYDLNIANLRTIQNIWIGNAESTSVGDISGITLSGTDPVSVQITAHGLTSDEQVTFSDIVGTTELNDNTYRVSVTDANNFTLPSTDSSDFTAWSSAGSAVVWSETDVTWELMTEYPSQLFEETVKRNTDTVYSVTNGTVISSTSATDTRRSDVRWSYYLKSGTSGAFMKFVVSPTPSQTYKIKIDYIKEATEITENIVPDIPNSYIDALVLEASSYILERSEKELDIMLSNKYALRSRSQMIKLVSDSHYNRSGGVDRPPAPWKV